MGVVSFWCKINHFGATNEVKFCYVRLKTKFFGTKFPKLYFLVTVLVTLQQQSSPPPRLVKIWTGELKHENLLSISKFVCQQTASCDQGAEGDVF